ncbi:P-loop NTPase fold protein [Clostridium perfringens]|uniref:P-loop NTPase fold protein n=1 Tax=Clostridium perfringens TaxID=1502 RepID=UPI001314BF7C|nr:P-loop NTPase fold protein [Clostridium perfringens]
MKKYWEEFKNLYNITSIIKYSLIISMTLLVIDCYNLPTEVISSSFNKYLLFLGILFIIVNLFEIHVFSSLKIKIVNDLDAIIICSMSADIIYIIISYLMGNVFNYRGYIGLTFFLACIFMIIYRLNQLKEANNTNDNISRVYTLKDLYNGNIDDINELVFINEEDIDYDLLNRGIIIEDLYNTITQYSPKRKFVISLEGRWGSGKTTILNILKKTIREKNEDIIVIDDFDPWSYNDQGSMFRGMFDILLSESGIKYSISRSKEIVDNLYNALFNDSNKKKIKALGIYNTDNLKQVKKIKAMINKYLEVNNKRVVFIIDNIDRIEKENITLLFKLVNNILDLEYVTYILSFDNEQIKKIMENDLTIDYDYLKKIVQLQVKVPEIDSDVKSRVINVCTTRLLIMYGEDTKTLRKYENLNKLLNEVIFDIRDFKRFINSVLSFHYKSKRYLNINEILIMELIKINNRELYESILENKKYFISHDKVFDKELFILLDKSKFNEEGKKYFKSLFSRSENKRYLNVLAEIFPYVNKYNRNEDLEYNGGVIIHNDDEYAKIIKRRSICSAKFFELYFTHTKNEFIVINELVEMFIKLLNNSNSVENILELLKSSFSNIPNGGEKVFVDTLYLYLDEIDKRVFLNFSIALLEGIEIIQDIPQFFYSSAREKVLITISELLLSIDEIEFDFFIQRFKNDFKSIKFISCIYNYMGNNGKNSDYIITNRRNKLDEIRKQIAKYIYDNNIDIYKEYYCRHNIWSLYHILKDFDIDLKFYVSKILNSENVFRFLYDVTRESASSLGYCYSIEEENILTLTSIEVVDKALEKRVDISKDEKFLLEIYNYFKEGKKDSWGNPAGIYLDSPKFLVYN